MEKRVLELYFYSLSGRRLPCVLSALRQLMFSINGTGRFRPAIVDERDGAGLFALFTSCCNRSSIKLNIIPSSACSFALV